MVRRVLTDADRYAILTAPDTESTADLAARIGKGYSTVYAVRRKIMDGEWSCDLTLGTCDTCDQPLLIPPHSNGMKRHRGCDTAHNRRRQARLRETDDAFRASVYARSRQRQDDLQDATTGLDRRDRRQCRRQRERRDQFRGVAHELLHHDSAPCRYQHRPECRDECQYSVVGHRRDIGQTIL